MIERRKVHSSFLTLKIAVYILQRKELKYDKREKEYC